MGIFTKIAQQIFASVDETGEPRKISEQEVGVWGTEMERAVSLFISSGGLIYSSKAALDADLAHAPNSMAWVLGDPIAANNGVWGKVGASGTGSWTRRADLPFSFIIASDAGAGTPNAIQATTNIPVSQSALIWMNVAQTNAAGAVTVQFNGAGPLYTVKTNSGNDPVPGGLVAGMIVVGVLSGETFRLVSDQASAAIVAAAEGWANIAQAAANGSLTFPTKAAAVAATIDETVTAIVLRGLDSEGDELGGLFINTNNGNADAFMSADGQVWYRARSDVINVKWFGAKGDGIVNDGPAIQAALDMAALFGAEVVVPRGNFYTDIEIKIPSYVRLRGVSRIYSRILASDLMPMTANVLTNSRNNRLSRTDYDEEIHISDLTVDGRSWGARYVETPDWNTVGRNICLSTCRNSSVRNVRSINAMLHAIDIMASVYLDDGNISSQPAGPSLHCQLIDCWTANTRLDDGITTHNSGYLDIIGCYYLWDRAAHGVPGSTQQGFEYDEGSWEVNCYNCRVKGPRIGFQVKGHTTTKAARNVTLRDITVEDCYVAVDVSHLADPSNGGNVTISGVRVINMNPNSYVGETGIHTVFHLYGHKGVFISDVHIESFGTARVFRIQNSTVGSVVIDRIHLVSAGVIASGETGTSVPLMEILASVAGTSVSISNVTSDAAQPRTVLVNNNGDIALVFEKIRVPGSNAALGVYTGSVSNFNLKIDAVDATGWGGVVSDTVDASGALYANNYTQLFGNLRFVTIGSGDPNGVVFAPPGTHCRGRNSGRLDVKNLTAGNVSTGWVQIA